MVRWILLLCVALGAGCTSPYPSITTPPVQMRFSQAAETRQIDRVDLVEVRARTGGVTNSKQISGARCDVFGSGYSAEFTTPAILAMPIYRGRTDDARITCRADMATGSLTAAETLKAKNLSAPENEGVTVSIGSSGTAIGAVFSIRDRQKDRFDYPSSLMLRLR